MLLSSCVLCAALLSVGLIPALAFRPGSDVRHAHSVVTPPAQQRNYTVQKYAWSNCNASLPLQLDDSTELIAQGDVAFALARFHTAVAIPSAYILVNITETPASTGVTSSYSVGAGLETLLLPPAALPIAAGATHVLLSYTTRLNRSVGHVTEQLSLFDAYSNRIGCLQEQYDVVEV